MTSPAVIVAKYAGQLEMVRKEERAVRGDGRERNFNEVIVGSSG